ncbi:MAG: tetratricopeptide repeat protein [Cyanobacteriota bacterium]|nr:tetratricopeptide repeat protein [Cyanobacteriota bacterium]
MLEESLKLARSYLTQGKLSQAIVSCQKILNQQPNCAEAYQILGQVFYGRGNLQKAMEAYTKAIEIKPDFAEVRAYLGQLYKDVHWWDEAAFQYQTAIQLGLNWPELYGHLGVIFSNKGDLEVAKNYCEKAIELDSNYTNAYFNLGLLQHQLGQLEASINTYNKLLKIKPDDANTYNNFGCVLVQLGKTDEAIEVYEKGLKIKPDWARLHLNLGEVLVKEERKQEAIAHYLRAIELEPDLAAARYDLGKVLQSMGEQELAVGYLEKAVEIEPNDILAWSDLGVSLVAVGRLKEAIACWQKAISGSVFVSYYCRGSVMEQGGNSLSNRRDVLSNRRDACSTLSNRRDACSTPDELDLAKLACMNFIEGVLKYDDAMSAEELQKTLSYLAETYFRFANVFMEYGDYENAQFYYQKALQIKPHNFDACWRLGNSLVKQQRYKAAILAYQMSLILIPKSEEENYIATVYFNLGKALEKEEKWELALEYYGKVWQQKNLRIKDQRLYKTADSKNGVKQQKTAPVKGNPRGLYLSTKDWIKAANIDSNNYLPVSLSPTVTIPASAPLEGGGEGYGGTGEERKRLFDPIEVASIPIVSKPGCHGLNCGECLKRIYWWFEPVYRGDGLHKLRSEVETLDGESNGEPATVGGTGGTLGGTGGTLGGTGGTLGGTGGTPVLRASALPTFVAKVPGGRAWIMPKKSYWMLCHAIAIITPDDYLLADVSRDYPGQLPGCEKHDPTQHLAFSKEEWTPVERIDGKVAILSSLSGNVYFHWMVDLLPRIEILRRAGIRLDEIDWFVVNNYKSPFQQETLAALGVPPEKVLASDRHPHIQAEELIVPSFGSHLGWLQPWGLNFLRNLFLTPKVRSKKGFPERIYISREKAKYRRVLNEGEVQELLSEYGFITVSPESMSLENQIALFAAAKTIVAPHGSGLTNIIFCQPGTKIIEFVAPHYLRYYYWGISQQLGLEHYYLPGEAFSCYPLRQLMYSSPLAEDILINLKSLKKAIESL